MRTFEQACTIQYEEGGNYSVLRDELRAWAPKILREVPGALKVLPTGSTAISGLGKDADYVVKVPDVVVAFDELSAEGWVGNGHGYIHTADFQSMRKGCINILLVQSDAKFREWEMALDVCLALQDIGVPVTRKVRHKVHRVIRQEDVDLPYNVITPATVLSWELGLSRAT